MAKQKWADILGPGTTGSQEEDSSSKAEESAPPTTVLMHTVAHNPNNPRTEFDYSDDDGEFRELKASMQEVGQLQPLAVISRDVHLRLKPDHAAAIGEADYVVVTGNRRLAAARQLGWTRIDIRVQDHLGDDDGAKVDDSVIIENIHRKNIAPIKEAEFLQGMVERHGSQDEVARRIGKSQMYVSHRLALLKLAPDIQAEVNAGTLKLKDARQLASKTGDHNEQRQKADEIKRKAAAPKPRRKKASPPVQNPVLKHPQGDGTQRTSPAVQNPVLNGNSSLTPPGGEVSPQPDAGPAGSTGKGDPPSPPSAEASTAVIPWHNIEAVARIICDHMSDEDVKRLKKTLGEKFPD
ncbi:ParB/RepB/Spo0J family partition protein [Streptomyces sp. NPDC017529]|uniref:ParB/RepB/Spo0J family partition protein n=1 Tax=Streptomyces sp. NPDC017529 TaxID=3365000 RepID=UPI0037990D84